MIEERSSEDQPSTNIINDGGKVDPGRLESIYEQSLAQDGPVTVVFTMSRDLDKRLDRYLVDRIPWMSRTKLQELIGAEAVTLNGRVPKSSTHVRRDDVIEVMLPPPPSQTLPAEEIPLDIIHEDDDLIVINKQDDIIVHPARGHQSGTLINGLAWHFQHRSSGGLSDVGRDNARPGVVHRLDRHTTGVMVAAKNDTAHWKLGRQFELRQTRKRYLALVHGDVEPLADVIDLPIGMHPTQRQRYAVRHDESAKQSVTLYRVRERYDGFTLVELELRTGRTHQIRVHLSHLGWSIAGDDWYGGRHLTVGDIVLSSAKLDVPRSTPLLTRQALHATLLAFEHPGQGEQSEFIAPLPDDMSRVIAMLRAHRFIDAPKVSGAELDLDAVLPG